MIPDTGLATCQQIHFRAVRLHSPSRVAACQEGASSRAASAVHALVRASGVDPGSVMVAETPDTLPYSAVASGTRSKCGRGWRRSYYAEQRDVAGSSGE